MCDPIGPMLYGMTYIVRPAIEPENNPLSFALIFAGSSQLLVGPASSLVREQINVRSSTRATSPGSERTKKLFGRFSSFSDGRARKHHQPQQRLILFRRTIAPVHPLRLAHLRDFLHPACQPVIFVSAAWRFKVNRE